MHKVYKRKTSARYIICSKLTLKTPDADLLSYQLWTWFTCYSSLYIADFEQVHLFQKPMFQHYTRGERHNGFTAFIVDFKHISHIVLVFLLLTLSIYRISEFDLSYSISDFWKKNDLHFNQSQYKHLLPPAIILPCNNGEEINGL